MGFHSNFEVCHNDTIETPQHCLMELPKINFIWDVFLKVWHKWEAPIVIAFFDRSFF